MADLQNFSVVDGAPISGISYASGKSSTTSLDYWNRRELFSAFVVVTTDLFPAGYG